MTALALVLAVAALATGLARRFNLPNIPLFLLGGLGLRHAVEAGGHTLSEELLFDTLGLGLAVIVFAAGVELSPRRVRRRLKPVLLIGLGQFFAIGLLMLVLARVLGLDWISSAYVGAALAASSTLVVVRHLKRTQRMFEPFGRIVTGVLLLQDAIIVGFFVLFIRLVDGPVAVALGLGQTLLLAGGALAAYRWLVPWVTLRLHLDEEENLLFAFLLLFAFVGGATAMDLPFIVGAFFAGFCLSAFPANGLFRGALASFSDFFIAVFFVVLGLIVALPTVASVLQAVLLGLGLMLCTIVLVAFLAERTGLSARDALQTGLLLTPTSEFSLILVLKGTVAGILSEQVFALVAFLTVATMSLTPFIATPRVVGWLMRLHPRVRGPKPGTTPPRDHILLVGLDYFGDHLIDAIREAGHALVILDDDAARVRALRVRELDCRQFRAIDAAVLENAGIEGARAILCAPRQAREAFELLEHARQRTAVQPYVRVFDEEEARAVEQRGGRPVIMTERTLDGLNAWMATLRHG